MNTFGGQSFTVYIEKDNFNNMFENRIRTTHIAYNIPYRFINQKLNHINVKCILIKYEYNLFIFFEVFF